MKDERTHKMCVLSVSFLILCAAQILCKAQIGRACTECCCIDQDHCSIGGIHAVHAVDICRCKMCIVQAIAIASTTAIRRPKSCFFIKNSFSVISPLNRAPNAVIRRSSFPIVQLKSNEHFYLYPEIPAYRP